MLNILQIYNKYLNIFRNKSILSLKNTIILFKNIMVKKETNEVFWEDANFFPTIIN